MNWWYIKVGATGKPLAVVLTNGRGGAIPGLSAVSLTVRRHDSPTYTIQGAAMTQVPSNDPEYEPNMWAYQPQATEVAAVGTYVTELELTINGKPYPVDGPHLVINART